MKKEHTVGDLKLHVEEFVPQEKTFAHPVVLVHGSFGNAMMWGMIAPALAENGFHVYALTLRGHKGSGGELKDAGMEEYKMDVETVVHELGLENPVVIGHSMSGLVALMYARDNATSGVIAIGPSPSVEVQGEGDPEKIAAIPDVYSPMDAGMPQEPMEAMQALSDIPQEMLMKMKDMLGPESGKARRDRKKGVSVPKESLTVPLLVMGGEHADSVSFGVSPKKAKKMSEYYDAPLVQIKGATHPGILMGEHAGETALEIMKWLGESVK